MKNVVIIIGIVFLSLCIFGCGRKTESLEEMQVPVSMESLSTMSYEPAVVEPKVAAKESVALPEQFPPPTVSKPTARDIQAALKNANYYTGEIDGKIGPMTRKAIEDFQKAEGLEVDGKVGSKTWSVLSSYLNPAPAAAVKGKKR